MLIFMLILPAVSGCGSPQVSTNQATSTPQPRSTNTASLSPSPSPTPSQTLTPTPTSSVTFTPTATPTEIPGPAFAFVVNADMAFHAGPGEYDTTQYFRGMCEKIKKLDAAHSMVSIGDLTPPEDALWTIQQVLGEDYLWFPAMGNHELNNYDIEWMRAFNPDINGENPPNISNRGPRGCEETNYSFNYGSVHFVILNVYCDLDNDRRTDGAIVDALYEWLRDDLQNNQQEIIFVFGHEPAFPQPDQDNGIIRHLGESLDKYPITRDRFWKLLQDEDVLVYFTGHTHSYSAVDIGGVWQIDIAHSMGVRTQATPSTFVMVYIDGESVRYETFRAFIEEPYTLRHEGYLRK